MSSCPAVLSTFIWPASLFRAVIPREPRVTSRLRDRTEGGVEWLAVQTSMLSRGSLIAVAIALAMPAGAPAASVSTDAGGAIALRDAGSETNAVTVALDAPNWVISDSATPLTAGAGCAQSTANEVRCAQTSTRPTAYLGDGDDTFAAPSDGGWIVYGEAGSDRLG